MKHTQINHKNFHIDCVNQCAYEWLLNSEQPMQNTWVSDVAI